MNDLQIGYFLEVVKNMSFSKTAKAKYISQPSISRHISNLEKELGYPLFDRTAKTLALTAAGKIFYDYFENSKKQLENAKEEAGRKMREANGVIKMAAFPMFSLSSMLIDTLDKCMKKYPNINIQLTTAGFRKIAHDLEEREVDIIMSLQDMLPPIRDAVVHKLMDTPRVIVYRKDLFSHGFQPTTVSDFRDMTFLMVDSEVSPYIIPKNISCCEDYGFVPKIKIVPNSDSMVLGAQNGDGVIIFHTWINWSDSLPIGLFPINPPHTAVLAWLKDNKRHEIDMIVNELSLAVNEGRLK